MPEPSGEHDTRYEPQQSAAPAAPSWPERIGNYRIIKLLGEGSFGRVFLAVDTDLDRQVAIKVSKRVLSAAQVDAFLDEARILVKLEHPHIVPVYHVERTDQHGPIIVAKFIDGPSLAQKLRQGRLTHRAAAELIAALADAQHFSHAPQKDSEPIYHRDIKPGNIFLDEAGKAYLGDFGLALRESAFGTGADYAGTPAYMSPEQAGGRSDRIDGRSDIYSLGVVLYELLTGKLPFRGTKADHAALLAQIAGSEPPLAPRALDDSIAEELERICLKAMAKKRQERYSVAADFARDLRGWLASEQAPPQTPFARLPRESAGPVPGNLVFDENVARKLPLPLAQLYRRAHNAKSAAALHNNAYFLWEAGLKLLASVAVAEYAQQPGDDPDIAERLRNLARPALGHWLEFVRLLVPVLAERQAAGYAKAHEMLLGKARTDLPRAAGLDALLIEALDGKTTARAQVRLFELFERLVRYRNAELGHGAAGQHAAAHYERLGRALIAAAAEVFGRLDVLVGGRLIYAGDLWQTGGTWIVPRYELIGENPLRQPSLELSGAALNSLPAGDRVYVERGGEAGAGLCMLHPLVIHDAEAGEVLFLNARRGRERLEYLCYTTGRQVERTNLGTEQRELLARVLGMPVADAEASAWAASSVAADAAGVGIGMPTPAASAAAPAGQKTLGEYELLSILGRGGMGVVYRAWQPSLGRQVALKKLQRLGDARTEGRFRREIHALGRVEHPNVVKIFTSGADGEDWFYVMELVEGATLASVCDKLTSTSSSVTELDRAAWEKTVTSVCAAGREQETPLSDPPAAAPAARVGSETAAAVPLGDRSYVRHVAELLRQAAEAAHALHEARILRRDIKPGNIMVTADGRQAVLMDLGLAQLADDAEGRLTRTRQFVGTLRYASPQQVDAIGELDRRADVYSLGATLWEMLTLRPLFGAAEGMATPVLMGKIQREEPERLRKYHPGIGRDLQAIVDRCLHKEAGQRYATAHELAADLGRFLRGEPVRARPVSRVERAWKWTKRRPAVAGLFAMALLMVLGVLGESGRHVMKMDQARIDAEAAAAREKEHATTEGALRLAADKRKTDADTQMAIAVKQKTEADTQKAEAVKQRAEADTQRAQAERLKTLADDRAEKLKDALRDLAATTAATVHALGQAADGAWEAGRIEQARDVLFEIPAKYRQWEWHYRRRQFQGGYATLYGHTSGVASVAFSPDGQSLASASWDQTVRLWDARTGQALLPPLTGHTDRVTSVAFSPDGQRLASASDDRTVRLWDARTGKALLPPLKGHTDRFTSVAFSPDGQRLASASEDKTVRLWDARTGKALLPPLTGHTSWVMSVAFSPDGQRLASASYDRTVRLWDTRTGRALLPPLTGHTDRVTSVAFSPDGQRLASASDDRTVRLWDARTGKALLPPLKGHTDEVTSVAFSPDGQRLASASWDKTVRLWDARTGKALLLPLTGHTSGVTSVAFSPDGQRLASASWNDTVVRLWDARTGKALLPPLTGHTSGVRSVAFSPDGQRLASASDDRTVRLWDARTGKALLPPLTGHTSGVTSVAFSPDGQRLASASLDKTVRLWDARTGQALLPPLTGHTSGVTSVAFSPDGQRLASASWDKTVRLWDARTGQALLPPLTGHTSGVTSVAFSPDGQRLASASWNDTVVRLWDARTGKALLPPLTGHTSYVTSVAFSPDGQRLASASEDRTVRLWDARTGQALLPPLTGHTGDVTSVAFSPDGQRLASASYDATVRLWDARTGQALLPPLTGHTDRVTSVAFSPDGQRLASASKDKTVRLWDAQTGKALLPPLTGHTDLVMSVAFSPDGQRLASASWDKTVRLWDARTGKALLPPLTGHTDLVMCVAFSPDGKQLYSRDLIGRLRCWDAETGAPRPVPGKIPPFASLGGALHPHLPLLAPSQGNQIELIDVGPPDQAELDYREAMARFDVVWQREQAEKRKKDAQADNKADSWFVAAFHWGQLAEHDPGEERYWTELDTACTALGDWQPAFAVCDRLRRDNPQLAPVYMRRARLRANLLQFPDASADLLAALVLPRHRPIGWPAFAAGAAKAGAEKADKRQWPAALQAFADAAPRERQEPGHLHRLAWAQLAAGRDKDFQATCKRLWENYRSTQDVATFYRMTAELGLGLDAAPSPLLRALGQPATETILQQKQRSRNDAIVYTACLSAEHGLPARDLVALAQRNVGAEPTADSLQLLGAAQYRAGQHADATATLLAAVKLNGNGGTHWMKLFLTMAHHQQGDAKTARAWLDKAVRPSDAGWEHRLIHERLHAEATALLTRPTPRRRWWQKERGGWNLRNPPFLESTWF